jgi:hypothetical protein
MVVGGLLAGGAAAQDASKDVVGKWVGSLRPMNGGQYGPPNPAEAEFKPDGAFGGSVNTPQFGLVIYSGQWKVEGGRVLVDYTAQGARRGVESSWNLKQEGDTLIGTGSRKTDNVTWGVDLKRSK